MPRAPHTGLGKCTPNGGLSNPMAFFLLGVQFHYRNQGRASACSLLQLCLWRDGVLRNGRQLR